MSEAGARTSSILLGLTPEEFSELEAGSRDSLVENRYHGVLRQEGRQVWVCDSNVRPCFHRNPNTAAKCAEAEWRRRRRLFRRWQLLHSTD